MGDPLPPKLEAIVVAALTKKTKDREAKIASGVIKSDTELLRELHKAVIDRAGGSSTSDDDFPPELHVYLATQLRKLMSWTLTKAAANPPTHRMGIGEDGGLEETANPPDLIFLFGGGHSGGGGDGGDGGGGDGGDGSDGGDTGEFVDWVSDAEQNRAKDMLVAVATAMDFGYGDDGLPFVRAVAQALGGRWGLNGKRGNPNDPSGDILAYDFPGQWPQLFDVLLDKGRTNKLTWQPLAYGPGAVWIAP